MLVVIGQILWICACALVLCVYTGWGLTALALPRSLRPYTALLTPLIGYALTILVGYLAVSTVLNLRWALALLLVLTTALNVWAWHRGTRPNPLSWLRDEAALLALLLLTTLIGVLPLLNYGFITVIGQGWDTESYFPMAWHLLDYPVARIPEAPSSPLRTLVSDPPKIGVTLGFSVFQGFTMLISQQTALQTFAPLLALLRTLGVLSIYIWLRGTMGLGRWTAWLGAAGASAGALMLWISYFNFGMQMSAWPLLGLGLVMGIAVVEALARPDGTQGHPLRTLLPIALLGGVVLAALPVAYYPALTIWVPMAVGLGAARLIEAFYDREQRQAGMPLRLVGGALALGLATLLLGWLTIPDYFAGFSFRYSIPAQHVGPERYIALAETIGLMAFRLPDQGAQPPAWLVSVGMALLGLLVLVGFLLPATNSTAAESPEQARPLYRVRWLLLIAAVLAYLAWLRLNRSYPYAYMKGSSYAGFVAWGAFAFGLQALMGRRNLRPLLIALGLAPLLLAGWSQALTIRDHWRGPAIFTRDIAAFDAAARRIPPGSTVAVTSDGAFTGPISGQLIDSLYGNTIWGHVSTAYTVYDVWPTGQLPDYALLSANEQPWPLRYGGEEIWRSNTNALYRLNAQERVLQGRSEFYSPTPPTSRSSPGALAIWRRAGANLPISNTEPLSIAVGDMLSFGDAVPQGASDFQQLRITVANLRAQQLTLRYGEQQAQVAIEPGVNVISLALPTPTTLTLSAEQPLALVDVQASSASEAQAPSSARADDYLAWSAFAEQRGTTSALTIDVANPGRHALRLELSLMRDTFTQHLQGLRVLAALPIEERWQLQFDVAQGATQALVNGEPTPLLSVDALAPPPDDIYFGMLTFYNGEQPILQTPVFTLQVQNGELIDFTPVPYTVEATAVGLPNTLPINLRALTSEPLTLDNGTAVLERTVMQRPQPWPGAERDAPLPPGSPLTVQLGWRSLAPSDLLMVSVQLLDDTDRKWAQWDGPVGGDWRPNPSWAAGDRVRQDVPLQLAPDTPPGTYRVLLVVYDPASGQPQPLAGQQALLLGEIMVGE